MGTIPISVSVPCETCCGERCSQLECRTRGGTVELCGWDEFAGYESTPPRFYLEKEIGGTIVLCDYHTPGGKADCAVDSCVSPVGWSLELVTSWACTPVGDCKGTNLSAVSKISVVDSYATPGSPGFVTLKWQGDSDGDSCLPGVPNYSWLGYINGTLFIGSFSGPGTTSVTTSRPNGTTLGAALTVAAPCSPGSTSTGSVCTGEGGSVCTAEADQVGSTTSNDFTNLQWCIPRKTSARYNYAGSAVYNPAIDCDSIATDTRTVETISYNFGCEAPTTGGVTITTSTAFDPALAAYVEDSDLNSGSYKGQTAKDACVSDRRATECDRYEQLQSEDTDEDGLARLLAGPGGTWSAWQPTGDGTGGTCLVQVCCRAAWEIRTYRTFEYKEAEWRATVSGQTVGATVTFYIGVYRRAFGVGPYLLFQTLEYTAVAGMDGSAQVNGVTPNQEGFETYVNCTFRALGP